VAIRKTCNQLKSSFAFVGRVFEHIPDGLVIPVRFARARPDIRLMETATHRIDGAAFVPNPGKHLSLNFSLRHEVARLIVWHAFVTRPVVPSAVSYEDVREGNDPYRALGHGTHSLWTGACTVREGRICQHQAEMGLDGWYGEHM
jgi:hypothetical protein